MIMCMHVIMAITKSITLNNAVVAAYGHVTKLLHA